MENDAIEIGNRRELFVDDTLIERKNDCKLKLHPPVARDVVLEHNEEWEGNTSYDHSIIRDVDRYRLYYRGSHYDEYADAIGDEYVCYAESYDGIKWWKPELGLFSYKGSRKNNIIRMDEIGTHNFVPFKDSRPGVPDSERYKAVARKKKEGLYAFGSVDGIIWKSLYSEPIITQGAFDSHNLVFWDPIRARYVAYYRDFKDDIRGIVTSYSDDFRNWSDPQWLEYPDAPTEHLYTNQIIPYFRAPQIYIGFPKRFVPDRNPAHHSRSGVSDSLFMTSRDGITFTRYRDAFIRPGIQPSSWVSRNNAISWGLLETRSHLDGSPEELSLLVCEAYYRGPGSRLRRYTLRKDGFVSLSASSSGGECITQPLLIEGDCFELNFSTSAAGSIHVEFLDEEQKRIEGGSLGTIYGDEIDRTLLLPKPVIRRSDKPIRMRIVLSDADIYSFRVRKKFVDGTASVS